MFSFFRRYRDPLVVIALLIFPLGSYLSSGRSGRPTNWVDRSVLAISSPLQSALNWVVGGAVSLVESYVTLRGSHAEAEQLRVSLAEAHAELNSLRAQRAENERLRILLGYVEKSIDQEIIARVVGLNPSSNFQSVRLNRGEGDGVAAGMPVVTADGAVGQVVRSVGGSADVLLITDPKSRIAVVSERARVRGTLVGTGQATELALDVVRREDDVKKGDLLVTAGTDGVFPKGVPIGRVREVNVPSVGMFLIATVSPVVDLGRVEEVAVIPVLLSILPPSGEPTR